MATQSTIARVFKNGVVKQVNCHYAGYIDGVGRILKEHYTDTKKLDKLLKLGDISTLGSEIGKKHSFSDRSKDQTTFYSRDRGDRGVMATTYESLAHYLIEGDTQEYNYIMLVDGHWFARCNKNEFLLI